MMDTSGTMISLVRSLRDTKIKNVWLVATHGIFSNNATERLANEEQIERVICTNTLDQTTNTARLAKLNVVDVSSLLAIVATRILTGESISALFE